MQNGVLAASLRVVAVASGTAVLTYLLARLQASKGLLAPDIHKPWRPLIPRIGGVSLLCVVLGYAIYSAAIGSLKLLTHLLAIVLSGFLGLYDDFRGLGPIKKLFIFMAPAILVVLGGSYFPNPYVPLVGNLRLTIIYPLSVAGLYTVLANGINMADTHNGTAPLVALITTVAIGVGVLMRGPKPVEGFNAFYLLVLPMLLAYTPFNMYPAKLFNGNCGSHLMGAMIASLIVLSRREFLALMVLTPLFLNGFSILASIRGLRSKESIERPVIIDKGSWTLRASPNPKAPITLVQLMVIKTPLREKEVILSYITLYTAVALISLLTYYLLTLPP
ncbi:MAG: hypothetical protein B6U73_03560 [Desulfurococcales archaeon ex4484_204]|nr:MAG: hypothetical protein B6U73_03560 [Desulfurococcales archaeon ex4484_204]